MIKNNRDKFELTSKKLRRARSLYYFILSKNVPVGRGGIIVVYNLAIKAKERGLFSDSVSIKDIEFSLYRGMYKYSKKRYQGWFEWLFENGYGKYPWFEKKNIA